MIARTLGNSMPCIGIVACLHGDERLGAQVLNKISSISRGMAKLIIANEEAMEMQKRYLEADLNRSFPGKAEGLYEERLACELLYALDGCDYVIDIHTTAAKTEPFVISTNKENRLVHYIPLKKVVYMSPILASGKALIDFVSGASLEYNECHDADKILDDIQKAVSNIAEDRRVYGQEFYKIYGKLEKGSNLVNFKLTSIAGEKFYPVLYGARSYAFSCLKAVRA
jgi:hypothetical protein